ncbi:uncharacterized protein LOC130238409 [Danio aesculapii]|uniref:uncharacterized protein LOC130238409 n=1 Tax=Danio aesculapii TaxID=1142201 RepID=UPI0024C0100D|nr:uncharacterized protein LOC130238409 [Danio aesculapii]
MGASEVTSAASCLLQLQQTKDEYRTFQRSKPCSLSLRGQTVPGELSKLQPIPPIKRQAEGTVREALGASANISTAFDQLPLQQTKEKDWIFRQLRPLTFPPRGQATPEDLTKLQPVPPPPRRQQQEPKTTGASANIAKVSSQPPLQQTRISLKEKIEAEPKAQREENKRRAEKIIEDILEKKEKANQEKELKWRSMMKEHFEHYDTLANYMSQDGNFDKKIDLLQKMVDTSYICLKDAKKKNKELLEFKYGTPLKILNERMTQMISEISRSKEGAEGIVYHPALHLKEEAVVDSCLDACEFIKSHNLQTTVKQRLLDLQFQQKQQEITMKECKIDEWRKHRGQTGKCLEMALAPSVIITGRKLKPLSKPPRAVKKAELVKRPSQNLKKNIYKKQ